MNTPDALKKRTKAFAIEVVKLVSELPKTLESKIIGSQLVRSGTSVGANYRSACRARSKADFVAKLGLVEEEADETIYWMEILVEIGVLPRDKVNFLMNEADQLVAIIVSSINTARNGKK